MKNKAIKTKLLTVLLTLCMVLSLVPMTAFAADPATETADFTASDGGAAAIALLNQYKSFGAADSTWDNGTKTLTLRGIDFTTKAATAVKLPDRTTIVLTDGTTNTITGGDAAIAEDGGYNKHMVITALKAMGDLKVKGGASGTGTLSVTSGTHKNTGEAWTYSCAIGVADGDFEIEGGHITAQGGTAYSADCAFSVGVRMDNSSRRSKILLITGGSLTAIGGESYDTEDPQNPRKSFSDGVTVSKGSISVTGSGKLTAKCVPAMDGEGLAFAVQTFTGDLLVSHNGEVTVAATNGISVSAGGIKLSGGKLRVEKGGVGATKEVVTSNTEIAGSIEVNGGALYAENSNFSMKKFTVTGGTVRTGSMLPDTVNISGGTVQTRYILAKEMTLSNATLTIREPVNKLESGTLYTSPALWLTKLTVNSGTLDVAWDWGEIEPTVFPMNTEDGFPTPLVKIWGDGREATFNGGISSFDTGCAGNIALKLGKLSLGENMVETGAANTNTDAHTQAKTGTPVVFSAFEPYPVRIVFFDAAHKTYDGTTAVTLYGTLDGVADGDDVTLDVSNMTAAFADANVGIGKTVNASGTVTLRGKDAYKYYIFQQPVLENITANITPRTEFTDATNKNQTIYVGGDSFEVPRFTGIGGETIEGSLAYNLIEATEKDIPGMLRALKAGDSLYIPYTFTADGNYSGERTGTITVTAQERPSYGGGGSHTSGYPVTVPGQTEHGSVTVNPKSACKGDTVTITVKPDSGYVLETLTAMDKSGSERKLTDKGGGKYTFTMPAGKVEVKATFMEDNSVLNFFYDVPNDSFYYEAVKWAAGKNIASGVGNNLFAPDQPCTRAQIVTFLWRAAGSPEPENSGSFSDVPASAYYAKAVAWAVENGITTGTGDGMFSPDAVCTRAQAVTFLWRYEKAPVASRSNPFTDVAADSYYADAVLWAVKEDITKGTTDTTFSPGADCTRAQIVTFLWRCKK